MKALRFTLLLLAMLCCGSLSYANPLKPLNPSIWTDYTRMDFQNLSQEKKTLKLQKLFKNQLEFCQTSGVRRALIRVLDPTSFAFFSPERFDRTRDDNFLYWAHALSQHAEIEVVFDSSPFKIKPSTLSDHLIDYAKYVFRVQSYFPEFSDFVEKLLWVSTINEIYDPMMQSSPLIKGVVVNPTGLNDDVTQKIVNALDQYKHNVSESLPPNYFPTLRVGMLFNLDQRNLAFSNLARFPIYSDIRLEDGKKTGIKPNKNFPGQGGEYLAPEWRPDNNAPLLDTAYINLADHRLVEPLYQNTTILPDPTKRNLEKVDLLAKYLTMSLTGIPYIKGPGTVTILRGTSDVEGKYTFFRTGSQKHRIGQFVEGGFIEFRPPYVEQVSRKKISENPATNKELALTSPYSTVSDINQAEYFMCPTPVRWDATRIKNHLAARIYFVFSTDFTPPHNRFLGNWHLDNFLHLLYKKESAECIKGFLGTDLFWGFNGNLKPVNNIVIHDFTTIPNGYPYPECNWNLGNIPH